MKKILIFLCAFLSLGLSHAKDLYEFKIKKTDGEVFDFSELKGKSVLFVNVATRCGYTGQLDDLEKLYQKFKKKDFLVVGIPSNDFGGQTPEGNKEVAKFCRLKYGVSFPLLEKTPVTGKEKPPLVKMLLKGGEEIGWNFEKFLVDKSGNVKARFKSAVEPLSTELTKKIEETI